MKGRTKIVNIISFDSIRQRNAIFSDYPDVLTVDQLQKALQIGRSTAYGLVRDGAINSIRIGRKIMIPKPFLVDYLLENKAQSCYNTSVVTG